MKKTFLLVILISVAIISCKKDHKVVVPTSATQKVMFNVGFSQTTRAINNSKLVVNSLNTNSTPDTSLTNHVNVIFYSVFDSTGTLVHNVYQTSTDTTFGRYTDNLHRGKYTVAISAGTGIGVADGGGVGAINDFFIYGPGGVLYTQGFYTDVFFERIPITVGNSTLTASAALNRITSRIIVNINDAIPATANTAKLVLSNVGNRYYIGTDRITNSNSVGNNDEIFEFTIPASAAGTTNYRLITDFMYLGNFTAEIQVGYTTNPNNIPTTIFGDKIVPNVTAAPNKITLLSGNLFGGTGTNSTGGFQVTTDTTWNTPIVKTFP